MTFFLGLLLFLHITITFFLVYFLKTYQLRADCIEPVYPKVSVIICAKNEAEHLKENLPKILAQHYPDYEVIVVNDNSTDDTETILYDLSTSFPRLRSFTYFKKNDESGKKPLLQAAFQQAKGHLLLLTDADCFPKSDNWIKKMAEPCCQNSEINIVLGYSPYLFEHENWLNRLIQHETTRTAFNYFSFAAAGLPYMGVGRNILYRKSLFDLENPFNTHRKVTSGDDDLTINALASPKNTSIQTDEASWVMTYPVSSWKKYFQQKIRHYSVATHYKKINKFLLFFQLSVTFSVLPLSIILLILKISTVFALYSIVIWVICIYFVFFSVNKLVKNKSILIFAPFLELIYYTFLLIISFSVRRVKTLTWKK